MTATFSALFFSTIARVFSRSTIYYGGLLLTAGSILLCAIVRDPIALVISVALGGLLLGAGNPLEQTLLQEVTPRQIAGQVFTSHTAISFAAGLLGLLIAGVITELTSVNLVLILGGGLLAIAATICWWIMPLGVADL